MSESNKEVEDQIRRRTIKAFLLFGVASLVPVGIWKWIAAQPYKGRVKAPLRKVLEFNDVIAEAYSSNARLAPTFPVEMAAHKTRVNSHIGMDGPFKIEDWKLTIQQPLSNGSSRDVVLSLDDLKAFPKHEIVFEFKCIEGWSQIQHWGGVRLADVLTHYKLGSRDGKAPNGQLFENLFRYVGMKTPNGGYSVGFEMPSAWHPQTLLCYEMNGQPLIAAHGAPLRLIIPVKYGIKNIKRVGTIWFSDEPPKDFWANLGYDYHAGL